MIPGYPHASIVKSGIFTADHFFWKNEKKFKVQKARTAPPNSITSPGSSNGHCWIPMKNQSQRKKKAIEKLRVVKPATRNQIFVNLWISSVIFSPNDSF